MARIHKICLGMVNSLIDLLYPSLCDVCGNSLVRSEQYLCTPCLADFPFADKDYVTGDSILHLFDESFRPKDLYSLFYYNKYSKYKNLIYLVKYHDYRQLGVYLGRMLGERMIGSCQADCIIPIPLHKKKEKERGFNQSLEIAKGISEILKIELMDDVIIRVQNNASQTGKSSAERLKNVENIFELKKPERIQGRSVLLVDDVITTGSTIGSCLRELSTVSDVKFYLACLAQTV